MAPVKKTTAPSRRLARKSATSGPAKSQRKSNAKLPAKLSKQVKTKPGAQAQKPAKKKKTPQYTDKQLSLPTLNGIVPANAKTVHRAGGTGKKKNKVYVDDAESMMTILAIVNAEKEGQIESKVAKERQMEEIREARKKEAEVREGRRRGKLEKVKEEILGEQGRNKREKSRMKTKEKDKEMQDGRNGSRDVQKEVNGVKSKEEMKGKKKRKSVSFA